MNIKFNDKTNSIIKTLALEAHRLGVKIYFVGGLLRDVIMGKIPDDIDILVEGSAIDFVKKLDFADIKSIHEEFGTIKVQIEGIDIDFASTRKESYPKSGALPNVGQIGCSVEEDLIRRDFTTNAIAAQILSNGEYKIIDIFNGNSDIKSGTLRVLHDKSFIDDPTRILRGLDFKLRFGFDFDSRTKDLISQYLKNPDREGLSTDRVILTLKKLLSRSENTKEAFREFISNKYYRILYDETRMMPEIIERAVDIFKPDDAADVYLNYIIKEPAAIAEFSSAAEVYKYFKNFSAGQLSLYWAQTQDDNALKYYLDYKDVKVFTTGDDLIKLGYREGAIIGGILDRVLEYKLTHPGFLCSINDEISYIKNNFIL